MKITLPKSLSEPLTIPWFCTERTELALVKRIEDAIYDAFAESQMHRKENMVITNLLDMLTRVAERNGAKKAIPHFSHLWSDDAANKTVGYVYYIHFSVPTSLRIHIKVIRSYFPTPTAPAYCESP